MHAQDKRAVETMCRCGLSLEGVFKMFQIFAPEEVESIYQSIRGAEQTDAERDTLK